jgi:hypothetical protein
MSKTTRKKAKFKNDLPADESKKSICRICLSFGRENVQSEAPRDVRGAQPAAATSSAVLPKRKRRASMNPLYFSDFLRDRIEELFERTVQIPAPRPGGDTNRQNDPNENWPRIDVFEDRNFFKVTQPTWVSNQPTSHCWTPQK